MNYQVWKIRKSMCNAKKMVVGWFRYCCSNITSGFLKRVEYDHLPIPVDWDQILKGRRLEVEIGSGHGELLLANNPKGSVRVGYEIRSRFFRLIKKKIRKREDIFVFRGNAYESLFLHYKDNSIDRIFALFPDPWHKKRHNKRRPLKEEFFLQIAQKLKKGGSLFVATDWPDYQEFITEEVKAVQDIYEVKIEKYNNKKYNIPVTHYHQKWVKQGRKFISFLLLKK